MNEWMNELMDIFFSMEIANLAEIVNLDLRFIYLILSAMQVKNFLLKNI